MHNKEMTYLLHYTLGSIVELLDEVLEDSEDDPQYSAVTLCNLIYCYNMTISVLEGDDAPKSICDFFLEHNYTREDYEIVEKKRITESSYYRGIQFPA